MIVEKRLRLYSLGSAVAFCTSCVGPDAGPALVVQDSAGVRIAFSSEPAWLQESSVWTLDGVPVMELASDPESSEQTLYGVIDAKLLRDGRIVVANAGSSQLFAFDSTGEFIAAWGRRGNGPGEFQSILHVARCAADTLMVREPARLSILDDQGRFVRSETLAGRLTPTGAFDLEGASRDCSAVLLAVRHARPPRVGERLFRYPTHVYWAPLDGSELISVDSFPGNELVTVDVGGLIGARFAFGVQPQWATDGEQVVYGPADRFEVQAFGPDGRLTAVIRWGAEPEPISEADWARYAEERRRIVETDPAEGAIIPTRNDHPNPDLKPAYSDLLLDDEGNIWVQRYISPFFSDIWEEGPHSWWVLDPDGRWLGEVVMPLRFELKAVERGHVIGVAKDELDVPRVQLLRIRKNDDA